MKFFNTAGLANQVDHYKIDPLTRWDLDEILFLIDQEKHILILTDVERQTGKIKSMQKIVNLTVILLKYGAFE